MLSKRYESTEVDYRTWLLVPSETLWSTSSDTHQVVEIWKETSTKIQMRKNTPTLLEWKRNIVWTPRDGSLKYIFHLFSFLSYIIFDWSGLKAEIFTE